MLAVVEAIHHAAALASVVLPASHVLRAAVERRRDRARLQVALVQRRPHAGGLPEALVEPPVLAAAPLPRDDGVTPVMQLEERCPPHVALVGDELEALTDAVAQQRLAEDGGHGAEHTGEHARQVVRQHRAIALPDDIVAAAVQAQVLGQRGQQLLDEGDVVVARGPVAPPAAPQLGARAHALGAPRAGQASRVVAGGAAIPPAVGLHMIHMALPRARDAIGLSHAGGHDDGPAPLHEAARQLDLPVLPTPRVAALPVEAQ
mmetsp:Transcript_49893/g.116044  ORF Transcript_49893/g.116044 Transcript_49893/m.116044 type:complete len:261 (+) Transcript_49893:150-932(+)